MNKKIVNSIKFNMNYNKHRQLTNQSQSSFNFLTIASAVNNEFQHESDCDKTVVNVISH